MQIVGQPVFVKSRYKISMPRHHFIPLSIITTFASSEAWRVVNQPDDIRKKIVKNDKKVLKTGQKRNWPVCVFDKDKKELIRKLAGKVCSRANLYGVIDYEDQLIRAMIRYFLSSKDIPLKDMDDLLRLGKDPLDSELIEKIHVGKIDNKFAKLLPLLKSEYQINETKIHWIYQFVTSARFRTPTWHRVYYPTFEKTQKNLKNLLIRNWNSSQIPKLSERSIDALNIAIDSNLFQMSIIYACQRQVNALHKINARIMILHNIGQIPFITCDNPSRPYQPDRVQRIFYENLPGIGNPKTQITFPLDPETCLLVSSNSSYPVFSHQSVREKQVRRINSALAIMAEKEIIFAGPKIDVFERWVDLDKLYPVRRP